MILNLYWFILIIPLAWFLQNCIHEASHFFAAKIYLKAKLVKFILWPCKYKGRFHFARVEYSYLKNKEIPNFEYYYRLSRIDIAPACIDSFLIGLVGTFILINITIFNNLLVLYLLPFLVCHIIDELFFWYTYFWGSINSDGQSYKRNILTYF